MAQRQKLPTPYVLYVRTRPPPDFAQRTPDKQVAVRNGIAGCLKLKAMLQPAWQHCTFVEIDDVPQSQKPAWLSGVPVLVDGTEVDQSTGGYVIYYNEHIVHRILHGIRKPQAPQGQMTVQQMNRVQANLAGDGGGRSDGIGNMRTGGFVQAGTEHQNDGSIRTLSASESGAGNGKTAYVPIDDPDSFGLLSDLQVGTSLSGRGNGAGGAPAGDTLLLSSSGGQRHGGGGGMGTQQSQGPVDQAKMQRAMASLEAERQRIKQMQQ